MNTTNRIGALVGLLCCLVLGACGSGDSEVPADEGAVAADNHFDRSELPADFPTELIPSAFTTGSFTKLGNIESAVFESDGAVTDAIAHYTDLLGEPTIKADAGEGERVAQWHLSPWMLGVNGKANETLISISRAPSP